MSQMKYLQSGPFSANNTNPNAFRDNYDVAFPDAKPCFFCGKKPCECEKKEKRRPIGWYAYQVIEPPKCRTPDPSKEGCSSDSSFPPSG